MSTRCKKCGIKTNDRSGICAICRFKARVEKEWKRQREIDKPTGKMGSGLTKKERVVWEIVKAHRGRENAIIGPVIAQLTGLKYDEVRHIISHLVNERHCLIASCSRGYYIPITPEEIDHATKSLRHRGIMILMRAARLQRKSLEEVFGQGKLEFEHAQRQR